MLNQHSGPSATPELPRADQTPQWPAPDPRIRTYYEETVGDYRWLWLSRADRALHFGYWDEQTHTHSQALLNLNRELARLIGVQRGARVLDAGCGIGGSTLWLARHFEAAAIGITLSPSQVRMARAAAQQENLASRFEEADYAATPFADGSFDVFWALESLCHAQDKPRVLAEARRLLAADGRIGFVEYVRRERPLPVREEATLRFWLRDWVIPDLATEQEWRGWLEAAGFRDVQVVDISANVRPSLRRLRFLAVFFGFGEWLLRLMRLRTAAQHANIRGSRTQWKALQAGSWREMIVTATRG